MFLRVLERRGRLYRSSVRPAPLGDKEVRRSLNDELAYRGEDVEHETTPGALLARLVHTVRAIRGEEEDPSVAVTGASIFDNRPDNFDPSIGQWLDALEDLVAEGTNTGLLSSWDERIRKLGSIMLGHLDDEYREEVNLIGSGAHRHRHRVLGNIYEQILKMTPTREDGELKLEVPDNGDDDQTILGAHYTPIDLVQEVVRPTLGQLFRQYWEESNNTRQYRSRIKEMTVVDPAMGSAHFLTVAALEVARELAWLEFFDQPRFEILEDWDEPLLHENSIGADPESEDQNENGTEGQENGQAREGGDAATVSEDRFYREEEHDAYEQAVRNELSGVIQRSIYGVDVNPLAAELGKLSLWLFEVGETDSDGSRGEYPELTYLDANIRCGDSVVGVFLEDVEVTVKNALRKSSDRREKAVKDMFSQSETVQEKLSRTKRYRHALANVPKNFGDFDPGRLDEDLREELDLSEVGSGYELREHIDDALRRHLADLSWLFDLTLTVRYLGYTSGSGSARAARLYRALFGEEPPGDDTSDIKPQIESAFQTLFESPDGEEALGYRQNLADWLDDRPDLNAFHWELEFPSVFQQEGFDAVVSNPPFIGDRDLRERLGSEDLVEYLASYFIPQKKKSDYSGFFFWRYNQILNDAGDVGSLASNSLCQASNREYVTKPLTVGNTAPFRTYRAVRDREWPGEADVHFSALHLSRDHDARPVLIKPDVKDPALENPVRLQEGKQISSYLDEYPDFSLKPLPASLKKKSIYTGMYLRGNFSIHRAEDQSVVEAIEDIPSQERDGLAAYLNPDGVQKYPRPTPSDVVIDLFEPLKAAGLGKADPGVQKDWIKNNYPNLLRQLKTRSPHDKSTKSVYEKRSALDNSSSNRRHKEKWWLFGNVRHGLRADWDDASRVTTFPAVIKIWAPFILSKYLDVGTDGDSLRVCPMHNLYVAPTFGSSHNAITSSFLFEMFTRRRCSSLETRLRFTPTEVIPYFPWPWEPKVEDEKLTIGEPPSQMKGSLGEAIENLLDLRMHILENPSSHGLSRSVVGGPTDLYNLYDADPKREDAPQGAASSAIEELRQAHVDLLNAVLRAYGWNDIADDLSREDWKFHRPWIDRKQRFIPPESVRAELFSRLDDLNSERFELERDMMIGLIAENLPEDGLTKTDFREKEPFSEMPIDEHQFEAFMEHEEQKMGDSRVKKEGYRWYAN
jgi:hypothetical protein